MLHVDANELYALPEAGRMLFADPARIRRWARQGKVPLLRQGDRESLPRAWVDAETGREAADAEAIRAYWLERLAPPPPGARRPAEDRDRLLSTGLLPLDAAARAVFADQTRLARLVREGTLPALRVDGTSVIDEELVDLVSREALDESAAGPLARRRSEVAQWARFEYVTGLVEGASLPPTETQAAPRASVAVAPHAWHVPDDVAAMESLPEGEPPGERGDPPPTIDADGFDTVEEDP